MEEHIDKPYDLGNKTPTPNKIQRGYIRILWNQHKVQGMKCITSLKNKLPRVAIIDVIHDKRTVFFIAYYSPFEASFTKVLKSSYVCPSNFTPLIKIDGVLVTPKSQLYPYLCLMLLWKDFFETHWLPSLFLVQMLFL